MLENMDTSVWSVIGVVSGVAASCIVAGVISRGNSNKLKQEQKIISIKLSLQLREQWSKTKYPEFAKFVDDLHSTNIRADDPMIRKFLGVLESVAIFWKENSILESHAREFFWPDLKQVHENPHLKNRLETKNEENPYFYANLMELVERSNTWKA